MMEAMEKWQELQDSLKTTMELLDEVTYRTPIVPELLHKSDTHIILTHHFKSMSAICRMLHATIVDICKTVDKVLEK